MPVSTYSLGQKAITFAVDVSGSTAGAIIEREKAAVSQICDLHRSHNPGLATQSTVLPWSHRAKSPLPATDVNQLEAGGGTEPPVLLENAQSLAHLQASNIWFLFTDGAIDQHLIHKFANAIPTAKLHGTACVIVLFGYAQRSPFDCNVSVGSSVFAVAPHCLFLFHDVRSDRVFVLQGKGCFLSILPKDKQFVSFGKWTKWDDLVQIKYGDLANLKVPAPAKLAQDAVQLPDGREFDMRHIYNDTISDADKLDILSDYKALDVILGAARTRGRGDDVKKWAENSRIEGKSLDISETEREDIANAAVTGLKTIVSDLVSQHSAVDLKEKSYLMWQFLRESSNSLTRKSAAHRDLRSAHSSNWVAFNSRIEQEYDRSSRMDQVFGEVLGTIEEYNRFQAAPVSPGAMSMMSSPMPTVGNSSLRPDTLHLERQSPLSPRVQFDHATTTNVVDFGLFTAAAPPARTSAASNMLFLRGFRGSRYQISHYHNNLSDSENYDTCATCGQENVIQTLLLRRWTSPEETPHLPRPNLRAGHKYPMILGNYPETDVVIPLAACDACALAFLRAGELPNGERVDSALPLVSLADETNLQLWRDTLEQVYSCRFHSNIVFLVFLSSLCSTIEDLQDNDEPASSGLIRASEWCCREICQIVPGIATRAGLTPEGSPLHGMLPPTMPLIATLGLTFRSTDWNSTLAEAPLLEYPLDGFVTLIRLAGLLRDVEAYNIERFVWKRLLFHFMESHALLEREIGLDEARAKLSSLLHRVPGTDAKNTTDGQGRISLPVSSISLQRLTGSYLMLESLGTLATFQRMGDSFSGIETTPRYHGALAVFLHLLNRTLEGSGVLIKDRGAFFAKLRRRANEVTRKDDGFHDVFEDPKLITDPTTVMMVEDIYQLPDDALMTTPAPAASRMASRASEV